MTAVCSVGIDMVAVPGDTTAEVISGLIADEIAIGVVNTKTTAVRVIPPSARESVIGRVRQVCLARLRSMPIKTVAPRLSSLTAEALYSGSDSEPQELTA